LAAVLAVPDRCATCGGPKAEAHDTPPHRFVPLDLVDVFLEAVRRDEDGMLADGEGDAR
jgi:hypothetical protein